MRLLITIFAFFFLFPQGLHADRFIPKSDLIFKVLDIVNHLYVDQDRIQPLKMLEGSMDRLSANIAPVLTQVEVRDGIVEIDVSVDQFTREFQFKLPNNVNDLNYILQQIVGFVKQTLEKNEKLENVDYAVINGLLRQLDPHSSLMIPEIYKDFSTQTSGNFGGVGMMISIREGSLTIISPIDNTPASRAGLKANDTIVQINEESTVNMPLSDAVDKLRGKAGTGVDIYVMRKEFSSPKKITIIRDIIEINSVKSFTFKEDGKRVGLIKINTFQQQNTIDEINNHLEDLDYDLKDFYGLIIDVRNNPGGLLDQAIKVSDRFLSDGVIVSTAGLRKGSLKSYEAHWFRSLTSVPVIVLINNGSASASEIFAAALKNNNRGVVLGIQTFGKGSVQQVIGFPDGSGLRLTTSQYLTPGNISIQSVGVSPHISVNPYYVSNDFLYVTTPKLDKGENSLEQNFSEWGDKAEPPVKSVFYLYDSQKADEEDNDDDVLYNEMEFKRLQKDFLVQSAVKILLRNKRKNFDNLMKNSLSYMEETQNEQEQRLINQFSAFSTPVDWKSYSTEDSGRITATHWIEIKKTVKDKEVWERLDGLIPAESEIRLFIEAKNTGKELLSRLMAISESENRLFDDRQFAFGKLEPGESRQWFVPLKISKSSPSRSDLVTFKFSDETDKELYQKSITLQTLQKNRPEFDYSIRILENGEKESSGNENNKIDLGEKIVAEISIFNRGKGESGALTALLKSAEGENIFLNLGRQSLKALKPGTSVTSSFQFDVKKKPLDGELNFSLDIIDSVFTLSSLNQKIKFPFEKEMEPITNKPPRIDLTSSSLLSKDRTYQLEGTIFDKKGVKDVYIFVNKKKIFYKNYLRLSTRNSVKFDLNLDLDKENNKIIIISRDDDNVASQKNMFVRRAAFK
jgi:carboxyl-terminal processing protease